MRLGSTLLAMIGLMGTATADEPRYHPAVGTVATFRTLYTNLIGDKERTLGYVYRLTTIASNDTVSEATLTPLALIYRCNEGQMLSTCQQAPNYPDITRDGDLIIVPIPPEISASLAKSSKDTGRDFLRGSQVFPIPGAEDIGETAKPRIGATPVFIQTSALDCDDAAIKPFFPLGATATLSVPCKVTSERSQSRWDLIKDMSSTEDVTFDLSFAGRDHIAVPAGDFAVASVKYKSTHAGQTGPTAEGDWEVLENIGLTARSSALVHWPNTSNTTHILRELIKLGS
jgi:hypothetical protein